MNIVLIGFMGTGKTTIGKILSSKLNKKHIDTDEFLEKKENKKIKDIFLQYGEKYFRRLEYDAIRYICKNYRHSIISAGGGIVLNPENIKILRQNSRIFLLNASLDTIYKNLKRTDISERPLLSDGHVKEKIAILMEKRRHLYETSAHYIIDIDLKTPEDIANEIIKIIEENN